MDSVFQQNINSNLEYLKNFISRFRSSFKDQGGKIERLMKIYRELERLAELTTKDICNDNSSKCAQPYQKLFTAVRYMEETLGLYCKFLVVTEEKIDDEENMSKTYVSDTFKQMADVRIRINNNITSLNHTKRERIRSYAQSITTLKIDIEKLYAEWEKEPTTIDLLVAVVNDYLKFGYITDLTAQEYIARIKKQILGYTDFKKPQFYDKLLSSSQRFADFGQLLAQITDLNFGKPPSFSELSKRLKCGFIVIGCPSGTVYDIPAAEHDTRAGINSTLIAQRTTIFTTSEQPKTQRFDIAGAREYYVVESAVRDSGETLYRLLEYEGETKIPTKIIERLEALSAESAKVSELYDTELRKHLLPPLELADAVPIEPSEVRSNLFRYLIKPMYSFRKDKNTNFVGELSEIFNNAMHSIFLDYCQKKMLSNFQLEEAYVSYYPSAAELSSRFVREINRHLCEIDVSLTKTQYELQVEAMLKETLKKIINYQTYIFQTIDKKLQLVDF